MPSRPLIGTPLPLAKKFMPAKHIVASSITIVGKDGAPRISLSADEPDGHTLIWLGQKDGGALEIRGMPDGEVVLCLRRGKSSSVLRREGLFVSAEDGTHAVRLGRIGGAENAIELYNGSSAIFRVVADPAPKTVLISGPMKRSKKKKK